MNTGFAWISTGKSDDFHQRWTLWLHVWAILEPHSHTHSNNANNGFLLLWKLSMGTRSFHFTVAFVRLLLIDLTAQKLTWRTFTVAVAGNNFCQQKWTLLALSCKWMRGPQSEVMATAPEQLTYSESSRGYTFLNRAHGRRGQMEASFVTLLDGQADVIWADTMSYFNCQIAFSQIIQHQLSTHVYLLHFMRLVSWQKESLKVKMKRWTHSQEALLHSMTHRHVVAVITNLSLCNLLSV